MDADLRARFNSGWSDEIARRVRMRGWGEKPVMASTMRKGRL